VGASTPKHFKDEPLGFFIRILECALRYMRWQLSIRMRAVVDSSEFADGVYCMRRRLEDLQRRRRTIKRSLT